jgi:hypothetical protein
LVSCREQINYPLLRARDLTDFGWRREPKVELGEERIWVLPEAATVKGWPKRFARPGMRACKWRLGRGGRLDAKEAVRLAARPPSARMP